MRKLTSAEAAVVEARLAELPEPVIDDENPEWSADDFAQARPASEVLAPEIIAAFRSVARGRPRTVSPKRLLTLRLDPEVIDAFRATGPGWQTRINNTLKRALPKL